MPYPLSATKLQDYHRCPKSYYFKYERGLKNKSFFVPPALGKALHAALAKIYWNWDYLDALPKPIWISQCWESASSNLSSELQALGSEILENYYRQFMAPLISLRKPLAVEGKIQAILNFCNIDFKITGRYDRLDWFEDGLELIDYKSTKTMPTFDADEIDLQIGLYYLVLEQKYHQSLKQMSLLYLQLGEAIVFEATPEHKQQVEATIGELAVQLRADIEWEPNPGAQCTRCTYTRYCPAVTDPPDPLPDAAKEQGHLQLSLEL
ncbi:MAG TPA: PD-(D/E)XK nuclease family protein [Kamptonema sp.]|nr:PD-(D/E)XK nuclease family protein [Kamptonema sp.]